MKQVLVTGSDGFVGRALCAVLAKQGVSVRCGLMEPLQKANAHDPEAIDILENLETTVYGSIGPKTVWDMALAGVDTVFHCAARAHVLKDTAQDPLTAYREVNVEGAARLARSAGLAGVQRLVYISSIGVHGSTSETPINEQSAIHPDKAYAQSKWEAEEKLREIAQKSSVDITIVRPPLVYGPGVRGNFLRLLNWAYKRTPLPLASIDNRRSFIALDNLISALWACAQAPAAANNTFVFADAEVVSTSQLVRRMAQHLGRPGRLVPCSPKLLRTAAKLVGRGEDAERLLGSLRVDPRKAVQTLGWKPAVSMDQGLARMCQWYLQAHTR